MQEEGVVKNVKKFVNEFENSRIEKSSRKHRNLKFTSSEKVAALRESLEKNMQQEYVPHRSIYPSGRSLADVKSELCKSMEALQKMEPSITISNLQEKFKSTSRLSRHNTTDALSKCEDDYTRRFCPIPAPRQNTLGKIREIPRRHKSNSDLTSVETSCSSGLRQECRKGSQEPLEDILERSGLSSKFDLNESQLDNTPEFLEEDNVFDVNLTASLLESPGKVDRAMFPEICSVNTSTIKCKNFKNSKSSEDYTDRVFDDSYKFCCRLSFTHWNNIITNLFSDDEKVLVANVMNRLEAHENSLYAMSNFDSILDVLTYEDSQPFSDTLVFKNIHPRNLEKDELLDIARRLETSLKASLNDVSKQVSCAAKTEKMLMNILENQMKLKTKLECLLKEAEMTINLLFLLNRMLQCSKPSPGKNNRHQKLNDAKEIKKVLDINCQKHFTKLKSILSSEQFEKCLNVLTSKLSLSLKRECMLLKLRRISEILKTIEEIV